MMRRAIVNVSTTARFQRGAGRLGVEAAIHGCGCAVYRWAKEPLGCPKHSDVPYAFKAFALREAAKNADLLLWCDSSIVPIRSVEPLWERIERDGYWFSDNGFSNYEWTADSAYPGLFPIEVALQPMREIRETNRRIKHVVATAFGINVQHPLGGLFLKWYFRLASETRAFCGPWKNTPQTPCGPPDVRGHRHDQTAASVIAWRLGMQLTGPPDIFAYRGGEKEQTILVADGSYL